MQLEDGLLIVLPRDEAKAFFGHREDQARLDFINEMVAKDDTKTLGLSGSWQALHDALADVKIDDSVLAQCLLGGRPMHRGDDYHVCLVRPDVVGFIAQQGAQLDDSHLATESHTQAKAVVDLYKTAAELGGAMVFIAKR